MKTALNVFAAIGMLASCLASDVDGINWDNAAWKYVSKDEGEFGISVVYTLGQQKIDTDYFALRYLGPKKFRNPDGTESWRGGGMPGRSGRRIENAVKNINVQETGVWIELESAFENRRISAKVFLEWPTSELVLQSDGFQIALSAEVIKK